MKSKGRDERKKEKKESIQETKYLAANDFFLLNFFSLSLINLTKTHTQTHKTRVTAIEAERLEGEREQRVAFERQLRAEVERQAREKGVTVRLPPLPTSTSSSSSSTTLPPQQGERD